MKRKQNTKPRRIPRLPGTVWRPAFDPAAVKPGARIIDADTNSYRVDDLFSALDVLSPRDGITPEIVELFTIDPCYPHQEKRLVLMRVRRGDRVHRLSLALGEVKIQVLNQHQVAELTPEFFTKEESLAVMRGEALRLGDWNEEMDENVQTE